MVFAELSDTVWLAIIGGVMLVVKQILDWVGMWWKQVLDRQIAEELKKTTAKEAAKVKEDLTEHLKSQDKEIQVVKEQTNGLVKEIKETARAEGHASGEKAAFQQLGVIPPDPEKK